ncbi:MAG TPA: sugar-transfer associated ATP-grasp domain-containing protein [Lunatimonas sp.]|nr:sugar-transfer associated ATP-grasp domain-containing protein [Lunatimonas sp.]
MILKRLLYLGYYLKNLNLDLLKTFMEKVKQDTGRNKISQWMDILSSSLRYNISLLEYYQFGFYHQKSAAKKQWAGTGFMYEYQLEMNPPQQRGILDDKRKFHQGYSEFYVHSMATLEAIKKNHSLLDPFLNHISGKFVLKKSTGKCGAEVEVLPHRSFTQTALLDYMEQNGFDMIEEFITQHPKIQELAPNAVNTIRIFTQLNAKDQVEILGCRMRISVNSSVDNMAAGNMAAPVDEATGIVIGPGVYSDITKDPEVDHPLTKVSIIGFKIPFWQEILEMVKKAALKHPQNRSIGWDIVVTENGPGLIEGNHDWCKLVWQLPVNQGLKAILERHLREWKEMGRKPKDRIRDSRGGRKEDAAGAAFFPISRDRHGTL